MNNLQIKIFKWAYTTVLNVHYHNSSEKIVPKTCENHEETGFVIFIKQNTSCSFLINIFIDNHDEIHLSLVSTQFVVCFPLQSDQITVSCTTGCCVK